jgi:hypothetical protein
MLIVLAVLLLLTFMVASRIRLFRVQRATHFGWMSERWIAEYRALH